MKTIVYKLIANEYKISEIIDGGAGDIRIVFETPKNAKLIIGGEDFAVRGGVSLIEASRIPKGAVRPILFFSGRFSELEGFVVENGVILTHECHRESVEALTLMQAELKRRVLTLEEKILALEEKINLKINF